MRQWRTAGDSCGGDGGGGYDEFVGAAFSAEAFAQSV